MSIGNFPESLSQAILVGRFLVGRLVVVANVTCLTSWDRSSPLCRGGYRSATIVSWGPNSWAPVLTGLP